MRRLGLIGATLFALSVAGCSPGAPVTESQSTQPSVETTTSSTVPATTSTSATTPPPTEKTRSVLVIGDWGAANEAESDVGAAMEAYAAHHEVEAILTTGDNFYFDDAEEALAPFDWVTESGIAWWFTWGNHDAQSHERIDEVNRVFSSPPRWTTVEWGGVAIIILDSNQIGAEGQIAYLDTEMRRIEKPTIVVFHHPPLNCSVHGDSTAFWVEWRPHFDDDVVLVLGGHAHNYQRFDHHGVQYVVTGGGGKSIYELKDCPSGHVPRVVGVAAHHYLALNQRSGHLTLTAITADGEVIDDISIPLNSTATVGRGGRMASGSGVEKPGR